MKIACFFIMHTFDWPLSCARYVLKYSQCNAINAHVEKTTLIELRNLTKQEIRILASFK